MSISASLLVAFVAIGLLLALWRRVCASSIGAERKWLPKELLDAELVYAEKIFRSGGDVPIVAKCDRGYRTKKGVIVVVELKTRHVNRTYLSDIIELSAQRFAIQMQTGEDVAEHGYVLVQHPRSRAKFLLRVELLSNSEVIALAKRREAILMGDATAHYAGSKRLCSKCAFSIKCNSAIEPLPQIFK